MSQINDSLPGLLKIDKFEDHEFGYNFAQQIIDMLLKIYINLSTKS